MEFPIMKAGDGPWLATVPLVGPGGLSTASASVILPSEMQRFYDAQMQMSIREKWLRAEGWSNSSAPPRVPLLFCYPIGVYLNPFVSVIEEIEEKDRAGLWWKLTGAAKKYLSETEAVIG